MLTNHKLLVAVLGALIAGCGALPHAGDGGALRIKEIASTHIGGRSVTLSGLPTREIAFSPGAAPYRYDPNGDFEAEQMYVHQVRLANPKARYPVFMWHGGGMTGVNWETKPDGSTGWQMSFLRAGYDVYTSDAVERARASWARYPEIWKSEPIFRSKKEAWELFRIGAVNSYATESSKRTPYLTSQFPVGAFDHFAKQTVPRWLGNDPATQAAYNEAVQKLCPCILIVHSQGGAFGINAALAAPDKVKGLVVLEGYNTPDPAKTDLARLKNVPHLFVWGDFIDQMEFWSAGARKVRAYHDALVATGVRSEWLELPLHGVRGNSHMLMMDRNSDEVAARIQAWLAGVGAMK